MSCHLLKTLDGQTERLWAQHRDDLEIGNHVRVVIRPFLKRPDLKTWERFILEITNWLW